MAMLRLFVSLGAVCSGQRESEDNRTDFIWFSERGPGVPPPPAGEEGGIDSESCPLHNTAPNSRNGTRDPEKWDPKKNPEPIPKRGPEIEPGLRKT